MELELIGTSHIAAQSVKEITQKIEHDSPDIIALELDKGRALSLLEAEKKKMSLALINQIGVRGYLFARLAQYVQEKLGKTVGMKPGSEMKTALLLARKKGIKVSLIDQPIQITLRRFSKKLTWREKGRFALDILKGLFSGKKQLEKMGIDTLRLDTVPSEEIITKMVGQLKERYPNVYSVLIDERNKYMVRSLVRLRKNHPDKKILAIVGAGHIAGMKELLHKIDFIKHQHSKN